MMETEEMLREYRERRPRGNWWVAIPALLSVALTVGALAWIALHPDNQPIECRCVP